MVSDASDRAYGHHSQFDDCGNGMQQQPAAVSIFQSLHQDHMHAGIREALLCIAAHKIDWPVQVLKILACPVLARFGIQRPLPGTSVHLFCLMLEKHVSAMPAEQVRMKTNLFKHHKHIPSFSLNAMSRHAGAPARAQLCTQKSGLEGCAVHAHAGR